MEELNDLKDKIEKILIEASQKKELKDIYDTIISVIPKIEKMFAIIDIEKSKDKLFSFSIISDGIIKALNNFRNKPKLRYEINFPLTKIIDKFLNVNYFEYINTNSNAEYKKTIYFINTILNIIENIRGSQVYQLYIRKVHCYMNFIFTKSKQSRQIISELINSFSIHRSSNFRSFNTEIQKRNLPSLCVSKICKEKLNGLNQLYELLNTPFLSEQYELLYFSSADILSNLLTEQNESFEKAYLQFGNFLCTLLFPTKFQIHISQSEQLNSLDLLDYTFIYNDKLVYNVNDFYHFNNKLYELTYEKEILEMNDKIVEICLIYVNAISKYDKFFTLQFICYLILRRIYFTFPQYRKDIKYLIISTLYNLSNFKGQFEWNRSLESRQFAYYLLVKDSDINVNIKSATAVSSDDIRYSPFILTKTNLTIGFNNIIVIDAGRSVERKIDVIEPNALVYITFKMGADEDRSINIKLSKFNSNEQKWVSIFNKDNVKLYCKKPHKIILSSNAPCVYKITFDNSNSWLLQKKIKYCYILMKPIDESE